VSAPESLAQQAYRASGCRTIEEFRQMLGGPGRRSLCRWLANEGPTPPMAQMVFRNIIAGWKPL
jgi:hypothetical protein